MNTSSIGATSSPGAPCGRQKLPNWPTFCSRVMAAISKPMRSSTVRFWSCQGRSSVPELSTVPACGVNVITEIR